MSSLLDVLGAEAPGFEYPFGASVVAEFVASHGPADVLRELVQNEYDAGGTTLSVELGPDSMLVRGNGKVIDDKGWRRLSVMLGTGQVAGREGSVEPKANGIGSKNFGLRSLFLFGDSIEVTSGGLATILDLSRGTFPRPVRHLPSANQPGVTIRVPYRVTDHDGLRAFGDAFEAETLKTISAELAATVIKLARPGGPKSLQAVMLRSARQGDELVWRQAVTGNRDVLRRRIRLEHRREGKPAIPPQTITEIEYQQTVRPPAGFERPDIPSYFKPPGGGIRIGVSFRTQRRNHLDLGAAGGLYYPIGAPQARTGLPVSVSAPFQMADSRRQIRDPEVSTWNAWLIEQAARFAVRILRDQLFPAFGAESFLAFDLPDSSSSTLPSFHEEIERLLRSEKCWPSRATRRGKPVYADVSSLTFPVSAPLAQVTDHFEHARLLHADLAAIPAITALARRLGGKAFTVGSLVRFRCAGRDDDGRLATKLGRDEASWYKTDFPGGWLDLLWQRRSAAAFDACRPQLRPEHRADLRSTPTTLTAANTLNAPDAPLWIIDETLSGEVPPGTVLHPELAGFKVLAGLCKPFRVSDWAIAAAHRIQAGSAFDEDREALHRYLHGRPLLSSRAWATVRRAAVLRDSQGAWAVPADMVSRSARGASLLAPALHVLTMADERNTALRPLRLGRKLTGADLVTLAKLAEQGAVPPSTVQAAIRGLPHLLTRTVVPQLRGIRFIETVSGAVCAAVDVYIRSERLVDLLGDGAPYAVISWPERLLKTLGCRQDPMADEILAHLSELREAGDRPKKPYLIYQALVDALRREKRPTDQFRVQGILWTGTTWETPDDCIVGDDYRYVFLGAVTVLPTGWTNFGGALGAHKEPSDSHWRRLLEDIDERFGGQHVPRRVAAALRAAYRNLHRVPEGLRASTRCLLDDAGQLQPLQAAISGRFLVNDDPAVAKAALAAAAPVAFADPADASDRQAARFFDAAGVRRLSAEAIFIGFELGPRLEPGKGVSAAAESILNRLRNPNFASAVAALSVSISGPHEAQAVPRLAEELANIERLELVDGLKRRYRLTGQIVAADAAFVREPNSIVVSRARSPYELRRSAANAIAEAASLGHEQALGDGVFFLLQCKTDRQLQAELENRKIPWTAVQASPSDDIDDEMEVDEETLPVADALSQAIVRSALSDITHRHTPPPRNQEQPPPPPEPVPLPELRNVRPRRIEKTGRPPEPGARGGGGGGGGYWSPRTEQDRERDRELGRRGEQIVFEMERHRITQLGLPADRVEWVAASDATADHDIRSIDDHGEDLFIEVKSTSGQDGRFIWPSAEFRLAIRERGSYVLYRVYEAGTTTPSVADFPDPISLLDAGRLQLDLDRLIGDVGPLIDGSD